METFYFVFGTICDILMMSLFIWHFCIRIPKVNKEIHAIMNKTKNCPYAKQVKRVK